MLFYYKLSITVLKIDRMLAQAFPDHHFVFFDVIQVPHTKFSDVLKLTNELINYVHTIDCSLSSNLYKITCLL